MLNYDEIIFNLYMKLLFLIDKKLFNKALNKTNFIYFIFEKYFYVKL